MNRFYTTLVLLLILSTFNLKAQDDLGKLLETSLDDANILLEGYVEPLMNGFGSGLAAGWYNTAKTHKKLGFDLTATVNLARVPDKHFFYQPTGLQNTTLISGEEAPTVFGPDVTPLYSYSYTNDQGETIEGEFNGPPGLGLEDDAIPMTAVPVPMVQLGIGVVKNTDLKIRWTPEVNFGDGTVKMIGFGVMHDIKQHISGIKSLPFDLSAFVGYTNVKADIDLTREVNSTGDGNVESNDGTGEVTFNTLTVQGIISKQISVLTVYGGVGYNHVTSSMGMNGTYTVYDDFGEVVDTYVDPIRLDYRMSSPRLTGGFRLKLAIVTLHGEYTLQEYSTVTAGFGFTVR